MKKTEPLFKIGMLVQRKNHSSMKGCIKKREWSADYGWMYRVGFKRLSYGRWQEKLLERVADKQSKETK